MTFRAFWALALLRVGCPSDLGDGPTGYSIKGTIQYAGERAEAFEQPVVAVFADTRLSTREDAPPPYALATFEDVDLDEPVPSSCACFCPASTSWWH